MRAAAALCVLMLALPACSSDPDTPSPTPGGTTASPSPTVSPSPTATTVSLADLRVQLRRVASGLSQPVGLTNAGGSTLYVIEQAGRIMRFEPGGTPQLYLDIRNRIRAGGERGLLGLAFHPDFASNRRLFVNYTNRSGDTRISEFAGDASRADPRSEKVLLRIDQPFANHNGGALVFDKEGMLLIATGDGGSGGDPQNNGQELGTLLGKILRIDVNRTAPYAIPADNPFRDRAGARPEIFHYGLRNPWRISIDRETGDLWIGDVGQNRFEEIDFQAAPLRGGLNFGWRITEGRSCFVQSSCSRGGLTMPVAQYDQNQGDCAVTGGYVYRGSAAPRLRGFYFYGDACSGFLRALAASDARDGSAESRIVSRTGASIVSFGEDAAGEVFLVMHDGTIMQLTA